MSNELCFENVLVERGGFQGLVVRVFYETVRRYNGGSVVLVLAEATGGKLAMAKRGRQERLGMLGMMPTSCLGLSVEQRLKIHEFFVSGHSCRDREHVIVMGV